MPPKAKKAQQDKFKTEEGVEASKEIFDSLANSLMNDLQFVWVKSHQADSDIHPKYFPLKKVPRVQIMIKEDENGDKLWCSVAHLNAAQNVRLACYEPRKYLDKSLTFVKLGKPLLNPCHLSMVFTMNHMKDFGLMRTPKPDYAAMYGFDKSDPKQATNITILTNCKWSILDLK